MIKLVGHLRPSQIQGVALSGGVDSMALLSFLRNRRPDAVTAYFFDHGTENSKLAREFLTDYCLDEEIVLRVGLLEAAKDPRDSWESHWRSYRYAWLHQQASENGHYIATAHHLNDVAETYVWGMAHGHPRFIHYVQPWGDSKRIVRPFLLTPKQELIKWCYRHKTPYIEDLSNEDISFTRNRIRRNIIPEMEQVNPGFLRTVAKAWEDFNQE